MKRKTLKYAENSRPPKKVKATRSTNDAYLIHRPQYFRLLDLPPEVRNLVYRYVLPAKFKPCAPHNLRTVWNPLPSQDLNILRANQQIYAEAKHILYTQQTCTISLMFPDGSALPSYKQVDINGKWILSSVRNIELRLDGICYEVRYHWDEYKYLMRSFCVLLKKVPIKTLTINLRTSLHADGNESQAQNIERITRMLRKTLMLFSIESQACHLRYESLTSPKFSHVRQLSAGEIAAFEQFSSFALETRRFLPSFLMAADPMGGAGAMANMFHRHLYRELSREGRVVAIVTHRRLQEAVAEQDLTTFHDEWKVLKELWMNYSYHRTSRRPRRGPRVAYFKAIDEKAEWITGWVEEEMNIAGAAIDALREQSEVPVVSQPS